MVDSDNSHPVGIIAGGGQMPLAVARSLHEAGRKSHLLGIENEAGKEIEAFPHSWFSFGEIGKLFDILTENNCREVVFAGSVSRPDFGRLRFDFGAFKVMPKLLRMLMAGGDQNVLSHVVEVFEQKGFEVRGVHEVAPGLVIGDEILSKKQPGKQDLGDISTAFDVIHALGVFDVGQAVVVSRNHVLAVEAVEGTDTMLERCALLRQWGTKGDLGVLVKCPKPGQDRRIDLPVIGPRTVELAGAANLAGIAVAAGETLIAERDRTIKDADSAGLFVCGLKPRSAGA